MDKLNDILHKYAEYIIGRMGIPYREARVNVICALSWKIGRLNGISAKTIYSNVIIKD